MTRYLSSLNDFTFFCKKERKEVQKQKKAMIIVIRV